MVVSVLSAALALAAVASGGGVRAQQAAQIPVGSADAYAQSFKLNPKAGSLSVGIGFGLSLANYRNQVGIAESRGIDLGIIGTLLAARNCQGGDPTLPKEQQPQVIHVEARGAQSKVAADGTDAGGIITKHVEATTEPTSKSVTTHAPLTLPGIADVKGARSEARTRWLANGVREAVGTSDIASLDIAGGMVKITGLHWESTFRSGVEAKRQGSFTLGSMTISGAPVPVNDPAMAFAAANQVLQPLGLALGLPFAHEAQGFLVVDPMQVAVIPNALRDTTLGTVFAAMQPVRDQLIAAVFAADCRLEDVVTVVDIAIGSVSGAGTFALELGGVSTTSREIKETSFLQRIGGLPPVAPPSVLEPVAPAAPATVTAAPTSPAAPVAASAPVRTVRAAPSLAGSRVREEKGGTLLWVALIGVALLLLAALLDVYKMRRAQRARAVEGWS